MSSAMDAWRTNLGIENENENQDTKIMNQTIVTCFLVEINDKINQNAVSNEALKVTQCLEKTKIFAQV